MNRKLSTVAVAIALAFGVGACGSSHHSTTPSTAMTFKSAPPLVDNGPTTYVDPATGYTFTMVNGVAVSVTNLQGKTTQLDANGNPVTP